MSEPAKDHIVCFNCGVDTTPLWRRDTEGNVICNACGLYFKLHNVVRPISMKRTVIKRRRRTPGVGNKKHAKEQRKQTEKAAKAILMMHGRQMPPVPALVPSYRTASAMSEEDVSSNYSSVPSSPQMPVVVIRSDEGMNCGGIQASLGMEYLMKAAELSPPLEPTKRFCEPTFSLLDSLATVATAEIALTKRFPISFGRADVERECERLASINNNTL